MFAGAFGDVEKNNSCDNLRMNSLNSVTSGLVSSLLLSLGFSRLAARFDQLNQASPTNEFRPDDRRAASACTTACFFQEV